MYKLIRTILFLFDPEKIHYLSMNLLRFMCNIPVFKKFLHKIFSFDYPQQKMGLLFSNPVGLGAGFDKNAQYLTALETLGFGFVEIGTVTPIAQVGNEKPRLFRLPKDKALINRMGFNNEGADQIATRLSKWRKKNPNSKMIIGGNIGKNKLTPNEDAWKDYEFSFHKLHDYVDYFVVNVSSPNTPGLRELQEKDALKKIFLTLEECNKKSYSLNPFYSKLRQI
jgi:dihydroorotate dehydrogenase